MAREDCGVTIAGNVCPGLCGAKGIQKITQEGSGRTSPVPEAEPLFPGAVVDHAHHLLRRFASLPLFTDGLQFFHGHFRNEGYTRPIS